MFVPRFRECSWTMPGTVRRATGLALAITAVSIAACRDRSDQVTAPVSPPPVARSLNVSPAANWKHASFDVTVDASESGARARRPRRFHVEHERGASGAGRTVFTVLAGGQGSLFPDPNVVRIEMDGDAETTRAYRKDGTSYAIGEMSGISGLGFSPESQLPEARRRQLADLRGRREQGKGRRHRSWVDALVVANGRGPIMREKLARALGAPTRDARGREHYRKVDGAREMRVAIDPDVADPTEVTLSEGGNLVARETHRHQALPDGRTIRASSHVERHANGRTVSITMTVSNFVLDRGGH